MIRLLIADSYPVIRAGLRSILSSSSDIQVVGEAHDGPEAIDKTLELSPDVVITDLRMANSEGLSVLRTLQTRAPQAKVILFTASDNKEDFIEAMKLGCCGILLKDAAPVTDRQEHSKSPGRRNLAGFEHDCRRDPAVRRAHGFGGPLSCTATAKPRERAQLSQREREIIVSDRAGL